MTKKGERYGDPILRTKLHRPKVTGDIVRRQRLHEQMDLGLETPLTLVSAPAGYGKSMLVSHWAESLDHPCAWVSLDRTDSELEPFVAYFLAAVESLFPESCRETATLLHAANLPPVPVLARSLANELDVLDTPFVLVLDDYHRIAPSSTVHELFTQLLEHPPHPLRLVLTTRHDPPLGLSALRAGNRLRELRLQDLRFTESETAELLAMTAKIAVSEDALANLQNEVEGWAVGLHLVSLALRHVENADSFINDLHGGLPHTQEYLLREVLAWQPPEVRDCILRSSILDRFCPEVLDAVCFPDATSAPPGLSGRELVELLQRNNLFIISLDARGEWFRFHHLFQNLLRRQLQQSTGATEIATLHSRAGTWFESQGLITESIEHALAARDVARAADIVERHRSGEINLGRLDVVARWLAMLPVATRKERLKLLLTEALILYPQVTTERLAPLIERVDALVQEGQPDDRELAAEVAFFKGYLRYWDGQGESSARYLEHASSLLEGTQLLIAALRPLATGAGTFPCRRGGASDSRIGGPDRRTRWIRGSVPRCSIDYAGRGSPAGRRAGSSSECCSTIAGARDGERRRQLKNLGRLPARLQLLAFRRARWGGAPLCVRLVTAPMAMAPQGGRCPGRAGACTPAEGAV